MNRRIARAGTLGLALSLLAGCAKPKPAADLKIGLIAELSGPIPSVGASCKNAAEMAVQEINETGLEISGKAHSVELVIEDSGGTAEGAAAAAKKLIEHENVLAFIGPNASGGAVAAALEAEAAKVAMITPWATAPAVTLGAGGAPRQYVFRACFTDPFQGKVLAKFGFDYMHATKAAVLHDPSSEAPRGQAEIFKKEFEAAGGKVVASETYKTGDQDFRAQLEKIKASGAELVFLPAYYVDVPPILKQARTAGVTVPFLGSDNWNAPELLKLAGADIERSFFCGHYWPEARIDEVARFVTHYKKRYQDTVPDDVAALTYDAFGLLAQALKNATAHDRPSVRDALAKIQSYAGVTGRITFQPGSGDAVKPAVMKKVDGGKLLFVTNLEP